MHGSIKMNTPQNAVNLYAAPSKVGFKLIKLIKSSEFQYP